MQKLTLAGNCGKDAVLRRTQSGDAILSFSLACSNGRDKDSTWYDCSIWGKRGEALDGKITKGTKLVLIGRPTVRVHEGKAYPGISVDDLEFMGGGQRNDDTSRDSYSPSGSSDDESSIPF